MAQGSPDWKAIVDNHGNRVFRIAFRILGSVQDAEDVSQNVFAEAVNLHAASPIQRWRGLLGRLASFRAIDMLRSRREAMQLSDYDRVSTYGPAEEADGAELSEWLRTAISRLPEQQGAVFSLAFFEQMERTEIAEVLEISHGAVSSALFKARQNLISHLNVFYGGSNSTEDQGDGIQQGFTR